VMRYAAAYKPDSEPLNRFTKRNGGMNECAARFSRYLEGLQLRCVNHTTSSIFNSGQLALDASGGTARVGRGVFLFWQAECLLSPFKYVKAMFNKASSSRAIS
jgi:hypothetical protein